jgi:hypothetical protein
MTMSWTVDTRPDAPADWEAFARRHGSFYHEPAWARALQAAFGFPPTFLVARGPAGTLGGVLPIVEVRSLLGRRRLVSLPFSYAAGPLADTPEADAALCGAARALAAERGVGRVEIKRATREAPPAEGFTRAGRYATYLVDTSGGESAVWNRLHASSTRRGIRKAEREGVEVERPTDEDGWRIMAELQAASSHGHGLPAPPARFFTVTCRSLQAEGLADLYLARAASGEAIGAIVLWKGARSWIYAFGASRPEALELRPTHALLWRAMRDAIDAGVGFDLGRAAPEQQGLVQFKERWGGVAAPLAYDYWPAPAGLNVAARDRGPVAWVNRVWSALPASVADRGSFLYRYLA